MIPIVGIMIGTYIITRMMHLAIDEKPHGIVLIFAIATILSAMVGMALLLLSAIGYLKLPGLL